MGMTPGKLWCVLAVLLLGGCGGPPPPLEEEISARNTRDYNLWWSRHRPNLSSADEARFLTAIQTIKLECSLTVTGQSSAQRAAQLHALLDGATVRQVIAFGEFIQIHRYLLENYIDAQMLDLNRDQLDNVPPGSDPMVALSIKEHIRRLTQRLLARKTKLDQLQAQLDTLCPELDLDPWETRPRHRDSLPVAMVQARFANPKTLIASPMP